MTFITLKLAKLAPVGDVARAETGLTPGHQGRTGGLPTWFLRAKRCGKSMKKSEASSQPSGAKTRPHVSSSL
jgi:hypothetical protein